MTVERRGPAPWRLAVVLTLLLASCTNGGERGGAPGGSASPTGDPALWREAPGEPYPYLTPIPPSRPTPLDGTYERTLPVGGDVTEAIPCRRCAPYRLNDGLAVLELRDGRYRVEHTDAAFRAVGHFFVDGSRLELLNDPNCPGVRGVYRWSVQGTTLTFEEVDDPCPYDRLRARYLTAGPWAPSTLRLQAISASRFPISGANLNP